MKCSVAVLLSFIICILGCVLALRFIEPIEFEIRNKYSLTMVQLKEECDSKDKSLYTKITADQDKSGNVRAQLTQELVKKAKAVKGEVSKNDWDKWTKEICIPNKILKEISISAIEEVQQCVDQKDQLNGEEISKAQKDLFKNFCEKVQLLAEHEYQASKLENP